MKKNQLKSVMAFASTDKVHPVICALSVASDGEKTVYAATDGYALVEVTENRAQPEKPSLYLMTRYKRL